MLRLQERQIREDMVARVVARHAAAAAQPGGHPLAEVINEFVYHEKERLRREEDGNGSSPGSAFVAAIRKDLPRAGKAAEIELLTRIVERYADEICGHFNPLIYGLATRALPLALSALLNGLSPGRMLLHPESTFRLSDQVDLQGDREWLCRLAKRGTLVFAPTHSSNLDPVIMGYALYRMGLPPVAYAAALNLFTNPIIGFFMRNVGAYAFDRKKTDPLYMEALSEHSTLLLENGRHSLFFPGGRRSRSNRVEARLETGLLGTALSAAQNNLRAGKPHGIYVVPCTISYPLVLEAATLIDDHFKAAGKARYIIENDEFSQVRRWLDFIKGLAAIDQQVTVTLCRPLDPFGNDVDLVGGSLDPRGRPIDPQRYLLVNGTVQADPERDAQYAKDLAERIEQSFRVDSVIFPTHVLARACFVVLRRTCPQPDLYRLLRTLTPDSNVPWTEVEVQAVSLLDDLGKLEIDRRVRLAPATRHGSTEVLSKGLSSFATYHSRPVLERQGNRIVIRDAGLLVYYSNRLHGYGLPGDIDPVEALT